VQPHRRRSRAAVEAKRQWTFASVLSVQRIGNEKHLGFDLAVTAFDGEAASSRRVAEQLAVDRDLMMRDHRRHLGHVEMLFLVARRFLAGLRLGFGGSGGRLLCFRLGRRWRDRWFRLFLFAGSGCFGSFG